MMERARMARTASPLTYSPRSVTNTHLSASPSCATPRSAPVSATMRLSSTRFSSVGSLGWPGNSPCGSELIVSALTPSFLSRRGVVRTDAPFAQSRHTVSPAFLMVSESTLDKISST